MYNRLRAVFVSMILLSVFLKGNVCFSNEEKYDLKEELTSFLLEYYEYRYNSIFDRHDNKFNHRFDTSEKVARENEERAKGFLDFQNNAGVVYSNVNCSVIIKGMEEKEGNYIIDADEHVTVWYNDDISTDNFSFVTSHHLIVSDDLIIEEDIYDECLVSGFCNMGYAGNNNINELLFFAEKPRQKSEGYKNVKSDRSINYASYNRSLAITYANYFALSVNPTYGQESNDCANFVSQCLYAGGIPQNNTGYTTGWYFDYGSKTGSLAWVNVDASDSYWQNAGVSRLSGTTSNIIPGNPFYWKSTGTSNGHGHQMICTSYNANGQLTYCAHNSNVSNGLVSSVLNSNSYSKYTLMFNEKCLSHSAGATYHYNSSSHWKYCTVCGMKIGMVGHDYIYSGNRRYCRFCGYSPN